EERLVKAQNLPVQQTSKAAGFFGRIVDMARRSPFSAGVQGLGTGAGLTVGAEFKWASSSDQLRARLWGTETFHNFYTVGTGVKLPYLAGNNLNLTLESSYTNAPQLDYYGPGNNSSVNNHTDYLREQTLFGLRLNVRSYHHVSSGCHLDQLLLN